MVSVLWNRVFVVSFSVTTSADVSKKKIVPSPFLNSGAETTNVFPSPLNSSACPNRARLLKSNHVSGFTADPGAYCLLMPPPWKFKRFSSSGTATFCVFHVVLTASYEKMVTEPVLIVSP